MKSVFASDLRLRPGDFPKILSYEGRKWRFTRYERDSDGDITCAIYTCDSDLLKVFND
jgi:hypothetical protein